MGRHAVTEAPPPKLSKDSVRESTLYPAELLTAVVIDTGMTVKEDWVATLPL